MTMLPKMRRESDKNLIGAVSGVAGMQKEIIDLRAKLLAAESALEKAMKIVRAAVALSDSDEQVHPVLDRQSALNQAQVRLYDAIRENYEPPRPVAAAALRQPSGMEGE